MKDRIRNGGGFCLCDGKRCQDQRHEAGLHVNGIRRRRACYGASRPRKVANRSTGSREMSSALTGALKSA